MDLTLAGKTIVAARRQHNPTYTTTSIASSVSHNTVTDAAVADVNTQGANIQKESA